MGENQNKTTVISEQELARQREFADKVRGILLSREDIPLAMVHTYGCQQNVADGERIRGMLTQMGYGMTDDPERADLILYNTCAIREHAELKLFGNVGALKRLKREKKGLIIALCGCMMQQQSAADKIKRSYPYVDLVFGTHVIHRLPEFVYRRLTTGKRIFENPDSAGNIAEGIPVVRDRGVKAWLPIMYGCNNFCTYCIVPYVRGRERSREPDIIINEAKELIAAGYKDITLLGQNVNSYGKNEAHGVNFAELLRRIASLDGDFIVRFMTSHPRDCTHELLDVMAQYPKIARHLHLPFQSGNDRVLAAMNRHYDRAGYLSLVKYAREKMPDISLTSDVIVGFPGETYDEFKDTLSLISEVGFTSLFTFIFSPRPGTPAASMPDPVTHEEKSRWFTEMTALQEQIAAKRTADMVGRTYRALAESEGRSEGLISARTDGNIIIEYEGQRSDIGNFVELRVTSALTWVLKGERV